MQGFLLKFISIEAQNSTSHCRHLFNQTEQSGCILWWHSVQEILSKCLPTSLSIPFWIMSTLDIYSFEPSILQTLKMTVSEVDNCSEQIPLTDLVKDAKSGRGFSPSRQFWVWQNNNTSTAWLPSTVLKCQKAFDIMDFFRIAGTLEAETSMSGKAQCSLAIGEN